MFRKTIVTILLISAFICKASAAGVALQIIQHNETLDEVSSLTYEIENNVMDYFFDRGCVISNLPAKATSDGDETSIIDNAMMGALTGRCNLLVSITVEYKAEPKVNFFSITEINWKLYEMNDEVLVTSGKKINDIKTDSDKSAGLQKLTKAVSEQIASSLKAM